MAYITAGSLHKPQKKMSDYLTSTIEEFGKYPLDAGGFDLVSGTVQHAYSSRSPSNAFKGRYPPRGHARVPDTQYRLNWHVGCERCFTKRPKKRESNIAGVSLRRGDTDVDIIIVIDWVRNNQRQGKDEGNAKGKYAAYMCESPSTWQRVGCMEYT